MENECEALPGVAYPGVRDNRSTINTKTGYDDDDDLSFNPLNTKLLSVQYLERVVSLSLFVSSASYSLYRVQINSLMFSSTHPSTDRNDVNDQTLLAVINSLLRPLKFVYNSTRLVDSCDDSLMRCFFGVIVCRYKRRPTLGAINVLDGQNS